MVALIQRVRKLEKKVADRSQIGYLEDRVVYRPSAEDLAEAVAILVECGAVMEVGKNQAVQRDICWPDISSKERKIEMNHMRLREQIPTSQS